MDITTATAVTKPRKSARLKTTSKKPSRKKPRKKLIKPTWYRGRSSVTGVPHNLEEYVLGM